MPHLNYYFCIEYYTIFMHISVYFRNYLKVVIILLICNIAAFDASVVSVVRGSKNPWESNQHYCGELLERTIEILCIEIPKIKNQRGM